MGMFLVVLYFSVTVEMALLSVRAMLNMYFMLYFQIIVIYFN
jgi:hypothetical protein